MSGRRSKKNQRLGSSRRGPKGLNSNIEKDEDEFQQIAESEDGRNVFHTSTDYHSTQFDHPPSSSIDQQTSALECPPHARGHKDSLMENELPERKRKMGSTRKTTGRIKVERKLDEMRTTEELDEEYLTQPNTSTTEAQHASLTEEQSKSMSFPSDLSLQTKSSELGKEPGTTLMFAVLENEEKDAIHYQEITSHSHEVVSDMPIAEAMVPSVHSIAVTVAESDLLQKDSVMFDEPSLQEIPIASTSGQKRRMGSTRRPLRGKNCENVGVQENSRNMIEDESKAEVIDEAKFTMSVEMTQTWDDVARDVSTSHTESALVLNQSLLAERAELKEPDVSAGTETMIQSVAFPLVDSEKPLPETSSHHGTPLLNKGLDFNFGSHTEDFVNKVWKEAESNLSDNSQWVPDTRKDTNTSYNFRDVNKEVKEEVLKQKEELSINDHLSNLLPKQDAQLEELALNDQEYSLSQHDIATLDNNCDCSMAQLIVGGSRSFGVPVSNISHAEPTAINLPHEMSDAAEEMQEIHMEIKQESNVCDVASITCDTLTDLECIMKENEDPQIFAARENENTSDQRGSETDNAFEISDQGDVRDHNVTQIIMDVRDNEKDGETSTETIWISHQKPCEVPAEKEGLIREQEQYSSNISQTHSPLQDDAGKMLETDEVRKGKKDSENAAGNDVTTRSEEIFSFKVSATDTGSHAHQHLFMQSPDKDGYDSHENVNEKSEKEGILFSVESENAAFDRGEGKSEGTEGIKDMDAEPVVISNVDTVYNDSESKNKSNRELTGEQTDTSSDTNLQILQVLDNVSSLIDSGLLLHDVVISPGEREAVPEESDISSFIPEDSQDSNNLTTFYPESQDNTADSERAAVGGDTDLHLEIEAQNKTFNSTTSETEGTKENIHYPSVLMRDVEVIGDTGTVESNVTTGSDFLDTSDIQMEALKVSTNAEKEDSGETDTILLQSDINIIPEEAHSKSSPVIHKRKMGSTRRPFKGNKGQRKNHDENEIFILVDEPNPDESRYTAVSRDTERHLENKTFDSTAFGGEATEENICEASVLVKEVEFIGDTVTVDSNMTTESDLIQNDTFSDAKLEALKVSDNAECEVQEETDAVPKQSDTTIIPEETQREEAHSEFTVIHKRKMGSTRRPLKGNKGQRKEKEHHDENEKLECEGMISVEKKTFSLEDESSTNASPLRTTKDGVKQQEMELCEENDVGPVEGSESALLQSSCSSDLLSEESTAVSICHVTESQTLMKLNEESQENAGEAEKLAAEEDKDLQSKFESLNKMFDSTTSEAEGKEENINDLSVTLLREVEVNQDTGTVESNMTTESDLIQNDTSSDAKLEALKVSDNAECEVQEETDAVPKQSDTTIIPEDTQREEAHSEFTVIHKRKMGSTRRPLRGKNAQRKEKEHLDENETPDSEGIINVEKETISLENEPSLDESTLQSIKDGVKEQEMEICEKNDVGPVVGSKSTDLQSLCSSDLTSEESTAISICHIKEPQTLMKLNEGSQENAGDAERVAVGGETDLHLEIKAQIKTSDSTSEAEASEENICEASVLFKEVEFIGDTVTVESNITTESDFLQSSPDALKVSQNSVKEVSGETDTILKQSDINIIPEDSHREEAHSKSSPVIHKRKMGSTRRPLKGNKGQRKEKEHHDENESLECEGIISVEKKTFSLEDESSTNASPLRTTKDGVKQQEMELCEENDVGPVEGSESALLQSSCSSDLLSEDSTAVSICHVTELQTLMKLNEESQENAGDAEKLAAEEDKDLQLKTESQNKMFDSTTSEAEGKEENISDVSVTLLREVEVNRDTGTMESNMTTESDFLQTSPDAHIEALKISEIAEKVPGETDTILKQSDISIIPQDSHREEAHSKSSPVIHKRKMGSTRRPLKGNKGQREEHDEKEIFSLEDEPSPDESRHTAVNVCDISESQTFPKIHAGSQENTGDVEIVSADADTELHLENKTFESTAFGGEATEENICEASVLVKEVEFIGDTVTVDSNMTTESDLIQNDTSSDAKLEALKVSDNAEREVQKETDEVPKQSDTTIIPEDTQREEAHSEFTVIHKRKMGSTRRPLRGKNAQRKEKEHLDENETPDSEGIINVEEETIRLENEPSLDESTLQSLKVGVKEQEIEICEKNDVGPVEGSESALLQSSCSSDLLSEESTAVSICHVTESQTLMKPNEVSRENAGVAEKLAAEEDKDLQLKTESQNKMFDSTTSEAEGTEENISDVSVTLLREVEVNRDTGTVESNMTTESDFLQTSPDAHIEALKISENAEKEVPGETDTILQQSDISIIPDDSHREEAHSKSSPVIHKRKMGSTRRPLKGNKGQKPEHDEKEIFSLEDESSPDESRHTAVNVCDISESQTFPKIHAGSQENTGDVEIVSADGDTERHLENKTFDSKAFGGEATEENICEASVLVKEVEFIGDTVTVDSNMTTESDMIQNDTSSDAKLEALKVSDNAECEVQEETDAVPKQSDTTIIPEETQREEAHSEFTVIHKRKMGSTRRPLRGKNAQRKEKEHLDENETPDSEGIINVEEETISLENEPSTNASPLRTSKNGVKEQEMELCKENDVGPVEGSESALLQSSCSSDLLSEESTAVSICHVTESQTLMKLNEESQENAGDAEKLAAEEEKDLQLKTESQNKIFDSTTSEAEGTEENISDVSVTLLREVEVNRDTGTVESNMTTESDFLQTSSDAHIEALKISENAKKEVPGETDTILKQSDISIIPDDSHREDAHSKSSPVIHKRKMGSTRRPLKGNKGQRPEHDEKEIFSLEDEPSPDESIYTAVSVCDISESQTLPKIHAGSQVNTGDVEIVSADGDTERHLENKTFDSTAFGGEATEENICEASVLVKEVEFIGDTVTVDSNMTTESDLIQNDTSSDAKLEALKVSDNAECEVQEETDTVPKQSDTTIIPEDTQREEAHSEFTVIHKRKMGSTRRPLRGKYAQRKEKEHLDENETPDSEGIINVEEETIRLENEPSLDESTLQSLKVGVKEQEIEICEKNDVGPVEGSESALLQSSCSSDLLSEESTAVSICHVTESQTLMKPNEVSRENAGDAQKLAAEEDKDLQLKTESQNKMFDSTTSEAEGTEENISDVSVTLLREVEVNRDTGTVESNMTTESDFLQTSPDAHIEALKISENVEKEVAGETDTILQQSDISIIPEDSHREEAHSKSSPVIHKRKMGSTRRPLKGNKGQRPEHHEKEIFSLEDEPSPDESRHTAVNVCDISESQTFPKIHAGSQENTGDVEIVSADGDTELHLENKTFDSKAFREEATEENICEASVLVKEVEFIGDTVTVDSNMTTESDLIQNDTSSDAKPEALKVSDNAECEVQEETDAVPKQSDTTIIPEDTQREEAHSEFTVIHKRKMGSTRRPLRGKNAQRKEKEHLDENETPDSEGIINVDKETISLENEPSLDESTLQSIKDGVKEQEMEICEKNDVGPVVGSKSTDLQSLCSSDLTSEESTAISICHIKEPQTLMKLNEGSQENAGDAERVAVGGETDLHLEIKAQIKTSDSTSKAEASEENICEASVLFKEVEFIGDTVTVESNITTESDFLQSSPDALKVSQNSVKEVSGETDTILKQSDINIIPEDSHREEAHSKSSPVIHKRKMGSTRRPLKGNKGQRKEKEHHDENESLECEGIISVEKKTFSLEDESSTNASPLRTTKDGVKQQEMELCEENDVGPVEGSESALLQSSCSSDLLSEDSTAVSICHVTELQTLMKLNEESQENAGDAEKLAAEEDKDLQLKTESQNKMFDSTTSEAEGKEENISDVSVTLLREVEVNRDTGTVESNMTTESDFLQTSPDAHIEALKISEIAEKVPGETDTILKQSDISIIPQDSHREEAHSKSSPVIHKRKMGSTRRPLKGNKGQREEHDEKEIFSLEDEPSPDESRHTAVNVCDISESQTFPKIHAGSQENTGDVEIVSADADTELHLENKTFESTAFGGEATEENICEASVLVKEVEFIGDTVTVDSNMTTESDLIQNDTSSDAKLEALKVSDNAEREVQKETDEVPKQSDTTIIPEDTQREKAHSEFTVIHKRKMGSTRRPLRGKNAQRKEKEHLDENETPDSEGIINEEEETISLENEPSLDESTLQSLKVGVKEQEIEICEKNDVGPVEGSESALLQSSCSSDLLSEESTAVSICHVTELQTLMKLNEESQENAGDAEKLAAEEDKDLQLKTESQNKMFDSTTSEAEGKEENISDVSVTLLREVEVNRDTGTVESNMTTESDFLQTSPDAHIEALKISENAKKEVPGETDTILKQSDISIIPQDSHREDAHSKSSPVIHKRKMGSTRRPLKGNKGQRPEHDEKEIFSLEDEPSPDESIYTAVSVCDISESQTLPKIHAGSQVNTGDVEIVSADGDTERHLENKTFDSTAFGGEATEENICEASVLVKEVEFIGDTVTVDSNMTTESDLIQNDTSSDAKLEALKVSDNAECEVQEETDTVPKQSDTTIIPEDTQREEAHSEFTVIHKRKLGSTRRPLRGKNAQRKEKEHLDENETPDSEGIINVEEETIRLENEPSLDESTLQSLKVGVKEQEIEICEKNDVGPVEGSESALLQSSCSSDLLSEESTAVSICHVTESQTLMKPNEVSRENAGDAQKLAAEEDKDLQLKTESQNKMFDSTTSEAEGTEENISDVSVTLLREVEVNRDTGTVESNMTTESDFLQTSPDAHIEALKISENVEKEVAGETDTILKQSDISIIPDDSHREEAHSKSSPVIHKRKMGSTRRPLKGNKGQRPEHHEKEIFSLEDEPSPDESRHTAVNVCDISESQTFPKIHAGSQENTGDVEIVSADGDTELHLENKTFDSKAFREEATEENICEASVLVKEVEFIGDTVTVDSNMTTESDLIQNDTSSDAKPEALKVSDNAECEVQEETDAVPKQSDTTIIPEDTQREEAHSEFTVIHKRKMGSTRRPLRGKNAQRKEKEHLDENETPDSEGIINVEEETISLENEPSTNASPLRTSKNGVKEQEMELCEENDVGPVEGSESAFLQSSCSSDLLSEESTAVSICHVTESQTLMKLNEESQENAGDAEKLAAEEEKDLKLKTESQNKIFDSTTSEAEGTEENISDVSVTLLREVEVNRDTGTVESNMTTESNFLQTSPDAHIEALKISENAEKEVSGETDTILQQSDISIIPDDSHREEAHSKSSPVIHKRKMGSTRRPLKGNKGQRPEHDEKEIFSLEDEPSPHESRNTAVNVCDISELQTLPKIHAGSQENTGDVEIVSADGDTERHLENKTFDSTTFGGEATEENICEASVLVKEVEFIGDTVTVDSNMTTESDLIQNDTSSDAKLEALKVSDNAECEVQEETDAVPKQSDTTIIPEDTQREEAHSEFTVIHKRKMGSTRRPLKGNKGQRKEKEHLDENVTPDSEGSINVVKETISLENEPSLDESTLQSLKDGVKEQEIEICEKNDVGPVEGSKSTDLQSLCSSDLTSEESTAISICHIKEPQTLMKLNEESQENAGDAERVAVGGETDLHLEIKAQIQTSDSTSEAEVTEENTHDASVLVRKIEIIGDTVTVDRNMTTDSDLIQNYTFSDAKLEALKVSDNAECEVQEETDAVPKQSDTIIIPEDTQREETHSKFTVIHKRKMGSTRRPLRGNKGQRQEHDEKEIFSLEDESRHTAVNVCDISQSQTFPKVHAGSQENTGDVEIVPADGDTERHLENKTYDSTTFGGEATEENICEASVLVKEVEFIGDTVTVESNITTESDFLQSSPDAVKVSQNSVKEVSGETDTILKPSDINIIPEDSHREETHSKSNPVIHKRKMGSTRRPLKGNKGQRPEHDEKEIFSLEDEPSPDESRYTEVNVCDISESQTLQKIHVGSQENTGDVEIVSADGDTERHLENKTFDSTAFGGEATEENICEASVLVKEVEFIGDTVTVDSNMTTESDLIQNDTSSDAKLEALKVSDNAECEVQEETDAVPKQSDTTIIPEDTQRDEAHPEFTVIHKRKMGSIRRPLRGNKGPRKVIEHHDENETIECEVMISVEKKTFSLEDESSTNAFPLRTSKDGFKEQEMELCEENDVGPVEGSESALLQSSCSSDLLSEESTAVSICHVTESQTLVNLNEVSQENAGDAENLAAEEEKDLQLKTESLNKMFDSTTSEAEGTEENISDVSVTLLREVEVIRDTGTVESNMTTESDFLQTSPDAHIEALKISENAKKEVSGETDTILKQSDISIIPEDSHREEAHSKSGPVIHKRKMGSTRRPLKGNKGQRLEDEPSPDESRHTAVSVCDISESQTFPKIHAGSQKNTGDVEIVSADADTELHLENKTFDSTAFGGEATEENICEASVLVKEVEFIGDTVTVESNITTESVFIQSSPDALKVSQNSAKEVLGETDTILKQSNISIIPEDSHREEAHSKSSPVIHKRKMGSTRRPLKGKNGQRNEKEHHDENETPDSEHMFNVEKETISLEDQPMYTAVSDILESQTLTKFHAESQEDYKDVERALVGRDTEPRSVQTEMTTLNSATFEGEGTEEIICEASVVVKEIEFIGDTVSMESNMTIKSDLLQNDISTDAKPEALMSEIAENEGKTDTIPKQSDTNIIPEVPHGEDVHTKLNLNVQKRKMGSTRRPLRGNKGQRKVRVESEEKNGNSEPLSEEEDTETHLEIQNQDNVVDHNVTQEFLNIRDNKDEERKTTKTVEELCDDLKLEQRSDVSQTQSGPSQDDTGSHLLEVPERTADFVIDRFAGRSHSDLFLSDALLAEETQIHVSSEDVLPTEMAEMHPVSKRSMQKRKMGSTRKRGKRMVNDEEVEEEKDGEAENTTNEDGTTKSEENLTVEEAIVGSPVPQQLFSSSADKESHEIQDIVSKSDVQTDISEQNDPNSTINPELSIEFECYSNVAAEMVSDLPLGDADTYLGQKQSVIPKESHREDQSSLNPIVQKRKMGSTRKTLRGNKGLGKEEESKKMDRESEEMTQEQDTEPHLATSERKTASKFDEEVEQNFPVEFPYPVAFSKMFPESENGGKEVSLNIHDLSEVSEEKESTGNDSNSENEAINLYDGTKDKFVLTVSHKEVDQTVSVDVYVGSEPEQTENTGHVFPTQELKSTQDDVVHEISSTQEKRRKMGSTRRNPRVIHGENMADNEDVLGVAEDRETKKAEDDLDDMLLESSIIQSKEVSSVSTTDLESEILGSATDLKEENHHQNNSEPSGPTVPETLQLVNADVTKHPQSETVTTKNRRKMGSTRKNLREGRIQGKRDGYEETETADTNLQMSQDSEMSLGDQTTHDYFNQPEDSLLSEIERALNKTSQSSMSNDRESVVKEPNHIANAPDLSMPENSEIKSLQPTPLAHSEPNSPGRRRKMGSTRKNPRQQLKAEREDEDKEDEEKDENLKTNKQENKDLERVEVSIIPNITENKLNKEYLVVSSAHTSSSELEESTNPVSQERMSPSTKRKFGSRRTNKGKQGLGSLATSDFGNELEDGDHKLDSSEVEDKLCSDDSEVCDPCLTLQPENQPITHPVSEQRNMEVKNEEVAAKGTVDDPVSLEQIIKHDRSTGAKQAVNLKNRISDAEVVQFNVVMVGNSSVGKTSFIRRFHEGQFTEDYRSTIGVDTCIQTIDLPDRTVKLQIWDTAGQERFHSITSQVFHRADGLLLMYEITCSNSFISVRDWISRAQERAPDDVIMMLLGNKNDSVERAVQIQEGADLAREYNINFMECSAATGANVSESMRTLAELLVQRKSEKERHTTLRREPSQKKSGCC